MTSIARRSDSNVNRHIKDRSPRAPDELALRMGRRLEMQTAKNPFLHGMHVVVLYKAGIYAGTDERIGAESFREKATLVPVLFRRHEEEIGNFQPFNLHDVCILRWAVYFVGAIRTNNLGPRGQ
jgi:hypothetical protein